MLSEILGNYFCIYRTFAWLLLKIMRFHHLQRVFHQNNPSTCTCNVCCTVTLHFCCTLVLLFFFDGYTAHIPSRTEGIIFRGSGGTNRKIWYLRCFCKVFTPDLLTICGLVIARAISFRNSRRNNNWAVFSLYIIWLCL